MGKVEGQAERSIGRELRLALMTDLSVQLVCAYGLVRCRVREKVADGPRLPEVVERQSWESDPLFALESDRLLLAGLR